MSQDIDINKRYKLIFMNHYKYPAVVNACPGGFGISEKLDIYLTDKENTKYKFNVIIKCGSCSSGYCTATFSSFSCKKIGSFPTIPQHYVLKENQKGFTAGSILNGTKIFV